MKIPFLYQDAAGLYMAEDELTWISLRRTRRRWRVLQTESVAVDDGDLKAALDRLKLRVSYRHVPLVTHLDAYHVRHFVVQGPALDDPAILDLWLQNESARRLPPGADPGRFEFRYRLLEQTEDQTRVLMVMTSAKAVQARTDRLLEAGFYLTGLTSTQAEIDRIPALQPGFLEGSTLILLHSRKEKVLHTYRNGVLHAIKELEPGTDAPDATIKALKSHLSVPDMQMPIKPNCMYIIGPDAEALIRTARDADLIDGPILEARVTASDAQVLSATRIHATALAFRAFFPDPNTINFLDPGQAHAQMQRIEKNETMHAVLGLGGLLMILLLVLTLISAYLDRAQAATDEQLLRHADQVAEIDRARSDLEQLESSVMQAERLVLERTQVAQTLEAVGRATPDQVWLDALGFETADALEVTLNGFAYYESGLNIFLNLLEQLPSTRQVQLIVSETRQAGVLFRRADLKTDRSISQFEIQFVLEEVR